MSRVPVNLYRRLFGSAAFKFLGLQILLVGGLVDGEIPATIRAAHLDLHGAIGRHPALGHADIGAPAMGARPLVQPAKHPNVGLGTDALGQPVVHLLQQVNVPCAILAHAIQRLWALVDHNLLP